MMGKPRNGLTVIGARLQARRAMLVGLAVAVALLSAPASALAQGHHGGGHFGGGHGGWHGGGWGWGLGLGLGAGLALDGWPGYYYPYSVYPDPYGAAGAPAVVAPPVAPSWYYCSNPRGYYPNVQSCLGGWQQVPATPPGTAP